MYYSCRSEKNVVTLQSQTKTLRTYYKKRLLTIILVWFTRATELRISKGKGSRFLSIYTNGAFGADVPRKEKLHEKVIIISTKSVLM